MQKKILIRKGDIAFAFAAVFILGLAAATFRWNIPVVFSLLIVSGLGALYFLNIARIWPALLALLLIFSFALWYFHFFTHAEGKPMQAYARKATTVENFPTTIFGTVLPPRQSELAGAIMSGSASALDADLKAQMSASGTSYIIGMYGYKINIFAAAIFGAGKRFFSRRIATIIVVAVVVIFIFVAAAPISAVRAAIMMGLVFLAKAAGRPFHVRNIFTFTAAGMLLFNPTLLGDVGFQLSFLSLLGIFALGPPLRGIFNDTGHEFLEWKSHAILALAVNAAIMPLVMAEFGDFSATSFVSNFLVTIPFAIVISLAVGIMALALIAPPLATLIAAIENIFLSYQLWVMAFFTRFAVPIPAFFRSGYCAAVYYALIAVAIFHYDNGKNKKETKEII